MARDLTEQDVPCVEHGGVKGICCPSPGDTVTLTWREEVLKHLKRAGHDRRGKWHKVYPHPGEWDIEMDEPGCDWGLWLVDDINLVDEEDAPRTQCNECTCGYSDLLNIFEPGEEERARVEDNEWRDRAERAVANQHQFKEWADEYE